MSPTLIVYEVPALDLATIHRVNERCYSNRASYWDRFPFPQALPTFFQKYHQPLLGSRVLDVGSGTGVLAKWLEDQGLVVQCLDPSPEMVRRCKEKNLAVWQGTIQDFAPTTRFASIFAILSLIHVPKSDFGNQIAKLASALEPGGTLFLGMLEGRGEGFFEGPKYPRFFAYYSREELLAAVRPYFTLLESDHQMGQGVGYMLFALQVKDPSP